jgi:Ca2+-binding RTX toxin-like protein
MYGADVTNYERYQIQAVDFGDGTVWTYAELLKNNGLHGTDGNDTIHVKGNFEGSLYGEGGNDSLHGGYEDDVLYGGDGDDTLYGNENDDVLDGGAGNDTLAGGAGDDTYLFGPGSGQDTINNGGGGNDLLKFEDIDPSELWFGQNGNHLLIGLVGTQDKVTVNNWFAGDNKIDTIEAGSSFILEAQMAQFLQAMTSIGTPAGADGQWTEEQEQALTPVLLTYWQSTQL